MLLELLQKGGLCVKKLACKLFLCYAFCYTYSFLVEVESKHLLTSLSKFETFLSIEGFLLSKKFAIMP